LEKEFQIRGKSVFFECAEMWGIVDLGERSVIAFSVGCSCRQIFPIESFVDIRAQKVLLAAKCFAGDVMIFISIQDHEMGCFAIL
jgi:hypothetical protein